MAITSPDQILKVEEVNAACLIIEGAMKSYRDAASLVEKGMDECNKDALSVDGKTLQDDFKNVADYLRKIEDNILDITDSIRNAAPVIRQNQINELNARNEQNNQ